MNIQEQEEMDFNAGRADDYQNAYALSSLERKQDDPRIAEELAKGKFVVVEYCEQFCPITDASLPSYMHFLSAWKTREEAESAWQWLVGDDRDICVVPFRMPEIIPVSPTDDLPF